MTIPNNTTYKLIGLAATGAAMLGMNLEDALCTDPAELARTIATYLTRHTTTRQPAEEDTAPTPTTERKAEQDAFRRAQEEAELARYLQPRICPDNRLTATGPLPEPEPPAPVDETAFFNL